MDLILFNSQGRKKEKFKSRKGNRVTLYTCGPTVYRSQHIGNYRTFLFEDILKRTLALNGYRVQHVMNITDVGHLVSDDDFGEDKVESEARKQGKNAWEIARFFEDEFKRDLAELNILPPDKFVRATDHIKEQIELIRKLEKKGYTYRTSDGIYFDTALVRNYGELALRKPGSTRAGSRVEMREKRHPTDFALWKFSPKKGPGRQMEWPSPWDIGFPGWHTECSAMSMKYLGSTLDIHTGGTDHIQIHHPNEIAQSEAATGKKFARFWLHGAFLNVEGHKMAKSFPETNLTIGVLKDRGFSGLDFRYLALGTHYRKPMSFHWEALEGAHRARLSLANSFKKLPPSSSKVKSNRVKKEILNALNDDLNTPKALARALKAESKETLLWADRVLGLKIKEIPKISKKIPPQITGMLEKREKLRQEKKWPEADQIRKTLERLGYRVEDSKSGPVIHRL